MGRLCCGRRVLAGGHRLRCRERRERRGREDPDPRAKIEDGALVVLAGWMTSVTDDPDPILGQIMKKKPPANPGRITVIEGRQPSRIQIPGLKRVESLEVVCLIAKGTSDGAGLERKRVLVRGVWQKAGFILRNATVLGTAP